MGPPFDLSPQRDALRRWKWTQCVADEFLRSRLLPPFIAWHVAAKPIGGPEKWQAQRPSCVPSSSSILNPGQKRPRVHSAKSGRTPPKCAASRASDWVPRGDRPNKGSLEKLDTSLARFYSRTRRPEQSANNIIYVGTGIEANFGKWSRRPPCKYAVRAGLRFQVDYKSSICSKRVEKGTALTRRECSWVQLSRFGGTAICTVVACRELAPANCIARALDHLFNAFKAQTASRPVVPRTGIPVPLTFDEEAQNRRPSGKRPVALARSPQPLSLCNMQKTSAGKIQLPKHAACRKVTFQILIGAHWKRSHWGRREPVSSRKTHVASPESRPAHRLRYAGNASCRFCFGKRDAGARPPTKDPSPIRADQRGTTPKGGPLSEAPGNSGCSENDGARENVGGCRAAPRRREGAVSAPLLRTCLFGRGRGEQKLPPLQPGGPGLSCVREIQPAVYSRLHPSFQANRFPVVSASTQRRGSLSWRNDNAASALVPLPLAELVKLVSPGLTRCFGTGLIGTLTSVRRGSIGQKLDYPNKDFLSSIRTSDDSGESVNHTRRLSPPRRYKLGCQSPRLAASRRSAQPAKSCYKRSPSPSCHPLEIGISPSAPKGAMSGVVVQPMALREDQSVSIQSKPIGSGQRFCSPIEAIRADRRTCKRRRNVFANFFRSANVLYQRLA
uniref:PID domain-containing protein n=1 Tax=Trichuris muris TaxID=70415 RepID=A0A5S6Q8Q0_TRIMR